MRIILVAFFATTTTAEWGEEGEEVGCGRFSGKLDFDCGSAMWRVRGWLKMLENSEMGMVWQLVVYSVSVKAFCLVVCWGQRKKKKKSKQYKICILEITRIVKYLFWFYFIEGFMENLLTLNCTLWNYFWSLFKGLTIMKNKFHVKITTLEHVLV